MTTPPSAHHSLYLIITPTSSPLTSSPLPPHHHSPHHHSHLITTLTSSPLPPHHHSHLITAPTSSPLPPHHRSHLIATPTSSPLPPHHLITAPISSPCHHFLLVLCSLQDQIMEVGGSRMQQQQAQLDKVVKEIDGSNAAITKAKVAIKTAER